MFGDSKDFMELSFQGIIMSQQGYSNKSGCNIHAIFFPGLFFMFFFLILLVYCGFGICCLKLGLGGWGLQLMGFGACGVGPSGFSGLGLSI